MILRALFILLALAACVTSATAETKLTDFNGVWSGTGQDRDGPLQSLQDTRCENVVRATLKRMNTEMTCERESGVRKSVWLTVNLEGDQFTGRITQKTMKPGEKDKTLGGKVEGTKTDTSANFLVRWSGITPNTTVDLKLTAPTSYTMKVTALGITMVDLTFTRTADRAPPQPPR